MNVMGYDRSALEQHPAFAIAPPSPELVARAAEAGWPSGLLERYLGLRRDADEIERALATGYPPPEVLDQWVAQEEALLQATLSVRVASWSDNDLIGALCANAPERVGDWQVVVERGPNAFAQFRLQEHAHVIVAEDQRVGLGMVSHSARNTLVGGERLSAHIMSGWRVRDGFRGMGLSTMLMHGSGPGTAWFGLLTYWYTRLDNHDLAWVSRVTDQMADRPEGWEVDLDQLSATITHLDPAEGVPSARARPITEADLGRCVELINRTHEGLDLFRPYTVDYLAERLNDPSWGPKPEFYPSVYGWGDFAVIEVDGEIVACGGLWNRGRDLRERWTNTLTGAEEVVTSTALMDFGFAAGHEDAMAELISHFLARTAELGHGSLMAALEFVPEVGGRCGQARPETRGLHTAPFTSPSLTIDAKVTRPYTDLAYW